MEFVDNVPASEGDSMAISYECPSCRRSISMVTNAGETQMVRSLGVTIGHEALDAPVSPMSAIRSTLAGQEEVEAAGAGPEPVWTESALRRLSAAPTFVQGMVRRLYTDYARQHGYPGPELP